MEFFRRFGVIMPMYFFLAITLLILEQAAVVGRELRPSDHGLNFFPTAVADAPTSGNSTAAMKSFFAGASTEGGISLPEAWNMSDPAWRRNDGGSGGGEVKKVFVLASLVCGIIGVVLLVVSGLIFVFRRYKKGRHSDSDPSPPPFQLVSLSSVHH